MIGVDVKKITIDEKIDYYLELFNVKKLTKNQRDYISGFVIGACEVDLILVDSFYDIHREQAQAILRRITDYLFHCRYTSKEKRDLHKVGYLRGFFEKLTEL